MGVRAFLTTGITGCGPLVIYDKNQYIIYVRTIEYPHTTRCFFPLTNLEMERFQSLSCSLGPEPVLCIHVCPTIWSQNCTCTFPKREVTFHVSITSLCIQGSIHQSIPFGHAHPSLADVWICHQALICHGTVSVMASNVGTFYCWVLYLFLVFIYSGIPYVDYDTWHSQIFSYVSVLHASVTLLHRLTREPTLLYSSPKNWDHIKIN